MCGLDNGVWLSRQEGKGYFGGKKGFIKLALPMLLSLFLMLPSHDLIFLLHVFSTHPLSISHFSSGRFFIFPFKNILSPIN